jgi:O-antigen/teichoic acid export membrane protein
MNHPEIQPQLATPNTLRTGGRLLARNTMLNLFSRTVPLLVAVLALPFVVRNLGPDRFGLLSLAWMVVGYFAVFDVGIGPATTKFVAELLGKGEVEKLPDLVWTALASQTAFGVAAGVLLSIGSPLLVYDILNIPGDLRSQAHSIFLILAFALPIDFVSGSFRGVLGASQRFDLLTAVGIPASSFNYLMPVAALALGFGLPAIVLFLVLGRLASLIVLAGLCLRLYPTLGTGIRFNRQLIRTLLGFGGWVTVSNAVNPILIYFDRFLIGALISIAAVGFYTPPYMISTKLSILPGSLTETLFPAFSASAGRGDSEWIRAALIRSLKFLLLSVAPVVLLLAFFAHPLLSFWLGDQFAKEGTLVLQILAVGVLVNSLALVPYNLLQAVGKPDLTAKFHLFELPLHVGLAWFLVTRIGLSGAAIAWTFRVSLDCLLLITAACWSMGTSPRLLVTRYLGRGIGAVVALAAGLTMVYASSHTFITGVFFILLLSVGYLLAAWHYVLTLDERGQIRLWLKTTHSENSMKKSRSRIGR